MFQSNLESKPISISPQGHSANIFGNSKMGATIVDSLDTLYLMGLMDEYKEGTKWVRDHFKFDAVGWSGVPVRSVVCLHSQMK